MLLLLLLLLFVPSMLVHQPTSPDGDRAGRNADNGMGGAIISTASSDVPGEKTRWRMDPFFQGEDEEQGPYSMLAPEPWGPIASPTRAYMYVRHVRKIKVEKNVETTV